MTEHYLDDSTIHRVWDNSLAPRIEIDPGDTVIFECREASNGDLTANSTLDDLINRKRGDKLVGHPLTGPVFVKGAQPGDALVVEILNFEHKGWGWNCHTPNFGLLQEDFDFPYLQLWKLEGDSCFFADSDLVELPVEPFCGVMGVAPAASGPVPTGPPSFHGGNMDIRGLVAGATLHLPVHVEGALFSTADCHAAQGDGEVSGTGIESPMTVTLRFGLRKSVLPSEQATNGNVLPSEQATNGNVLPSEQATNGNVLPSEQATNGKSATLVEPQFFTPSPLTKTDTKGYFATTAHGPDLFVNSQNAVRYMIDWLEAEHRFSRSQAYCLCSAAADLKISEIVDLPNWLVSCYLPLSVLRT